MDSELIYLGKEIIISKRKPTNLAQNIINMAKWLVNPNNPDSYGRKIFTARINSKKLGMYYKNLQHAKSAELKFTEKYPNADGRNYPRQTAQKLQKDFENARGHYKENYKILHDRNCIIKSIANASTPQASNTKSPISKKTAKKIILAFDHVDHRHRGRYMKEYCSMAHKIGKFGLKRPPKPLSEALRLYQFAPKAISLAANFKEIMGTDFKASQRESLSSIFNKIKLIYPPALLQTSKVGDSEESDDAMNVVFFNPLKGYWTHNYDDFAMLVRSIKPVASTRSIHTLIEALASHAATMNRRIRPYHGNRYLLYYNGVYDTDQANNYKTGLPDKLLPLTSQMTYDIHFTERAYHIIDLEVNPPLPQYNTLSDKTGQPHAHWTPLRMLNGYANFDKHIREYFLFCLSLGLFSNHNFGISLDIKGPSGAGKTVLTNIFKTIYGSNRVNVAPFSNLNGRFVFTSYHDNTAVIWFDEANIGSKPLNGTGISTYDNLNDPHARFQVKNLSDHLVDDPPMVFIDGTDFLRASNPEAGPYRRTLVMKFPNHLSSKKLKLVHTNELNWLLNRHDVVEWLNWAMIMAYRRYMSNFENHDNLMINLTNSKILNVIPLKARLWRENLRNPNTNITEWFTEVLEPCLNPTVNDQNPRHDLSRVQKAFMYNLFKNHMMTNYGKNITQTMSVTNFWNAFKTIAESSGWSLQRIKAGHQPVSKSRLLIKQLSTTHINFDRYVKTDALPSDYTKHRIIKKAPFNLNKVWFYIIKTHQKH